MNAHDREVGCSLVRPDSLEVAGGYLAGDPLPPPFPPDGLEVLTAREALEQAVLPALKRPPCVVDFSGGRDSSVVLVVAAEVARREGLPLPVAFTRRFPLEPMAEESHWQELVIEHLRLPDWERAELTEELDLIGERAQRFLRRYGLLLPAPTYHLTLSFEHARGGSYLTGEGGDEMLDPYRARLAVGALASPKRLLRRRQLMSFASNIAPRRVRSLLLWADYVLSSRFPSRAWMRPEAFRRFAWRFAVQEGAEPLSWQRGVRWQASHRLLSAMQHNNAIIAADYDVVPLVPLVAPGFAAALARSASVLGFSDRAQAMTFVAGDLLPTALLRRTSKAGFSRAYFTDVSRDFAESWDGSGVDVELVDPDALKRAWSKPLAPAPSYALLQAAWMAKHQVPVSGGLSGLAGTEEQVEQPVGH